MKRILNDLLQKEPCSPILRCLLSAYKSHWTERQRVFDVASLFKCFIVLFRKYTHIGKRFSETDANDYESYNNWPRTVTTLSTGGRKELGSREKEAALSSMYCSVGSRFLSRFRFFAASVIPRVCGDGTCRIHWFTDTEKQKSRIISNGVYFDKLLH